MKKILFLPFIFLIVLMGCGSDKEIKDFTEEFNKKRVKILL